MFTDAARQRVWEEMRQQDCRAFARFLQADVLSEAATRAGVALGRGALSLRTLVWLAVASARHATRSFADVLTMTFRLVQEATDGPPTVSPVRRRGSGSRRSRHDPRREPAFAVSEEAFVKARRRMPPGVWSALLALLTERFEQQHAAQVRWKRFRLLALDGTTVNLPRWKRLSTHYGTARNGAWQGQPQARMVLLQLPLVRLPWRYELVPLEQGERTCAARLLCDLRRNDLVLMDRGFWSYGLFHQIAQQQAFFAIRLHPQARPRTVRRLGRQDRRVRWKKPTGPRWRGPHWPPHLELRIIEYRIRGFRPSAVVTNILDPQTVSRAEWVHTVTRTEAGRRLDQGLYHRRWEIETTFHELKVVQGMERHLRSRTPEGITYEVAGHVLLYLLVRWLMVQAAVAHHVTEGRRIEPLALSFRHALSELLDLRPLLLVAPPERAAQILLPRLLRRIASSRVPFRPGRHFPRPHDTQIKHTGRGSKRKLPHKLADIAM